MKIYNKVIQINPCDNVGVAIENIKKNEIIHTLENQIVVLDDIPKAHKIALCNIRQGEVVIKYGYTIGLATTNIKAGSHVHEHNIKTTLDTIVDYSYRPKIDYFSLCKTEIKHTFLGYKRSDGRVGTRNEIWIIPTVGCVNKTAEIIQKKCCEIFGSKKNGIFSFSHPYGCSQLGDDLENTQKILAGLVNHPNAAGVLVVGLGCENNNIEEFKKYLGNYDSKKVKFLSVQEVENEIEDAVKIIEELIEYSSTFKRTLCPVSELIVGLKCGGSDAFSGITSNTFVGTFSDKLIECGGTSLLTEVPEMFGAETILMNRCINEKIFNKTVEMINSFKKYYLKYNQPIYENPSPGNKKGGITTLEEKSLGCINKAGISCVRDVLKYGERVSNKGLNLLYSPGNDIVSSTALAAAGAQIIIFTTGRGTPLGTVVPTIKVSSNSELFQTKKQWIDFDAGQILNMESRKIQQLNEEFFKYVLDVASGVEHTKNEIHEYKEIAILKDGPTL